MRLRLPFVIYLLALSVPFGVYAGPPSCPPPPPVSLVAQKAQQFARLLNFARSVLDQPQLSSSARQRLEVFFERQQGNLGQTVISRETWGRLFHSGDPLDSSLQTLLIEAAEQNSIARFQSELLGTGGARHTPDSLAEMTSLLNESWGELFPVSRNALEARLRDDPELSVRWRRLNENKLGPQATSELAELLDAPSPLTRSARRTEILARASERAAPPPAPLASVPSIPRPTGTSSVRALRAHQRLVARETRIPVQLRPTGSRSAEAYSRIISGMSQPPNELVISGIGFLHLKQHFPEVPLMRSPVPDGRVRTPELFHPYGRAGTGTTVFSDGVTLGEILSAIAGEDTGHPIRPEIDPDGRSEGGELALRYLVPYDVHGETNGKVYRHHAEVRLVVCVNPALGCGANNGIPRLPGELITLIPLRGTHVVSISPDLEVYGRPLGGRHR